MDSHEKYLELCAASTAGELSGEEERTLEEHLAVCASCRQAKHKFEMTVERAGPAPTRRLRPAYRAIRYPMVRRESRSSFFQATEHGSELRSTGRQRSGQSRDRADWSSACLSAVRDSMGRTVDAVCGVRSASDRTGGRSISKWVE